MLIISLSTTQIFVQMPKLNLDWARGPEHFSSMIRWCEYGRTVGEVLINTLKAAEINSNWAKALHMKGRPLITVCFLSGDTFHFGRAANTSTKWPDDRFKSIIKQIVKGCTVGLDEPWCKRTHMSIQLCIKACSSSWVLRTECWCFTKSSDAPCSTAGSENRWGNPKPYLESRRS